VKRASSALMQAVAVERSDPNRPPPVHARSGTKASRLLLGAENAVSTDPRQTRDRTAISSDDVLRPGLYVANVACERLLRFTKADRPAHPHRALQK